MPLPESIKNDPRYADFLEELDDYKDLPKEWIGSPIETLIAAENFGKPAEPAESPQLLIATCIEFRYALPIPRMYAYVIRRASGRLNGSEFSIAYVLSRGVKHLALIGHNDCGMTKVAENAPAMVRTLIEQGWNKERAHEYITYQAARHSISNELTALEAEYRRLKRLFRKLTIAPLFVCLADTRLYLPKWYHKYSGDAPIGTEEGVLDEDLLTLV